MPFEAAKAVSATFCWKIRYALTPLFGLDFPSMCIHPSDRALYGRMTIDPAIIKKATEAANLYRMLELRRTPVSVQSDPPRSSPYARPHHHFNRRHASSLSSAVSISSSSSPADYGDAVCVSPVSDYRNAFTPVNTPRSSGVRNINMNMSMGIPSPQIPPPQPRSVSSFSSKNNQTDNESGTNSDSSLYSDPAMSESDDSSSSSFSLNLSDCAVESQPSSSPRLVRPAPQSQSRRPRPGPGPGRFAREVKAAHALLSLYMQDATSDLDLDQQTPKARALRQARKRRRASA